jgi:predicted nucleic acid-binding protein
MVPAPVLAEYWVGATAQERHEKEIFEIATQIAPFDAPAAILAAEMFRDHNKIDELVNRYSIGFHCIKIDIMIAAIAITNERATRLVTHDRDLYTDIVQNRIEVVDLPDFGQRGSQKNFLDPQ